MNIGLRDTFGRFSSASALVMLVFGLSICCCNLHQLTLLVTEGVSENSALVTDVAASSCCSRCDESSNGGDVDSSDEDSSVPSRRCCMQCCIKGSGLDQSPQLIAVMIPLETAVLPWVGDASHDAAAYDWRSVFAQSCGIPDQRLYQQHCALRL